MNALIEATQIHGMRLARPTSCDMVLARAVALPPGTPFCAADVAPEEDRPAARRALSRLVARGLLLRAARGVHLVPVHGRFSTHASSPLTVVGRMVATGDNIVPHGAAEANRLGLSAQVPMRHVFLTDGRSRILRLGACIVELRHAPSWMTPNGEAGAAVRAMQWLVRSESVRAAPHLRAHLPVHEWNALLSHVTGMPRWMAEAIRDANLGPQASCVASTLTDSN